MKHEAIISRWRLILIIIIFLGIGVKWMYELPTNKGYAPEQPIPFSHKIHVTDNRIDCLYCHNAAESSRHASIPAMGTCMGCHSVVAVNKPNIIKLKGLYEGGTVLQWIRVYELPDHVYFSHSQHVRAGIACQICHGPVESMNRIIQVNRLEMGDCVECHRKTNYTKAEYSPVTRPGFQPDRGGHVYPQDLNFFSPSDAVSKNQKRSYLVGVGYTNLIGKHQNAPDNCNTCHQ